MTPDMIVILFMIGMFIILVIHFYLLLTREGGKTVDRIPVRRFYIAVYEGSDWEVKAIPVWSKTEPLTPADVSDITGIWADEMEGLSIYGGFDVPDTYERAI